MRWQKAKTLPKAFSLREKLLFLVLALSALTFAILFGRGFYLVNTEVVPDQGGHYNEGIVGQPNLINPLFSSLNSTDRDLEVLIFSKLFRYNSQQELVPDLVEDWNISDDKKEYFIRIKEGVLWHDKEPLTSDDIIFTIHRILDTNTKSPLGASLRGVTVEKLSDYEIKLTLKEPYAPFLGNLTFGILPAHIWETVNPANMSLADDNLEPIGSGSWQFDRFKKDKKGNILSFSLKVNESYYATKPFLKRLTFKFFTNFDDMLKAFESHQIQGMNNLSVSNFVSIKDMPGVNFHLAQGTQSLALFFNPRNNIALEDKRVRQAIEYAIDKTRIVESARQGYAKTLEVPIFFGVETPEIEVRNYNPDKAKELLRLAGYTEENGKLKKSGKILTISLVAKELSESLSVVEIVKENLEAVGMDINLEIIPAQDNDTFLFDTIGPREFEILFFGETLGHDPDPYVLWHSSQIQSPGLNISLFDNKKADQLLEEARKETDPEKRKTIYQNFQKILYEEAPAIFLYSPQFIYAVNQNVKGVEVKNIVFYADRLAGLNEWYMETKRRWK